MREDVYEKKLSGTTRKRITDPTLKNLDSRGGPKQAACLAYAVLIFHVI